MTSSSITYGNESEPKGLLVIVSCDSIIVEPYEDVSLEVLQDLVGGYIERVPLPSDSHTDMWVNENGISLELPPNLLATRYYRRVWCKPYDANMTLFGVAVFTGGDDRGATPLSTTVVDALLLDLIDPQQWLTAGGLSLN